MEQDIFLKEDIKMNNEKCKGMSKDHIKGIKCGVKNCVYHDCENRCTAEKIAVGPSYALSSSETICATFKPKEV